MILEYGADALRSKMTSHERRKYRRQLARNDMQGEALKAKRPRDGNYVHRPPMVSALEAARAKKVFRSHGWAWPGEEREDDHDNDEARNRVRPVSRMRTKLKGHKHDRAREVRKRDIEERMSKMDETIARYRATRRRGAVSNDTESAESIYDELFLTAKERRVKEKRKMQLKAMQQGGGK